MSSENEIQSTNMNPKRASEFDRLLKRFLSKLFSKWVGYCETKGFESIDCPLCGTAKRNRLLPPRGTVYLARVRFGTVNQVASIEDAVDKKVAI